MNDSFNNTLSFLGTSFDYVWRFANSSFFVALISTLFAAFAGAFGAQVIIEKAKNKEILLKEIRNTNAAIMVAFGICNSFLSLKKQHIKSLKETFDQQKKALDDFKIGRRNGTVDKDQAFEFQADFPTITPLLIPTDVLQSIVFENISLNGRPLSLATTLTQTAYSVNDSLQKRNQLIDEYRAKSPLPDNILVPIYFGLPDGNGHIDNSYPATIDAIYSQTDDCIFFSNLLSQDLVQHGEEIRKGYIKKFGKTVPTINKPDFTKAEQSGLMPDAKNYVDWIDMFVKKKSA